MSTEQDRADARALKRLADCDLYSVDAMTEYLSTHRTTREAELESLFALQQTRMAEATSAWQQATGETGLPDLGRLLTWLLAEAGKRETRRAVALGEAAASLETIANFAGRMDTLETIGQIRGYADSRARVARAALEREEKQDAKE
jgi:hypothetical protein